MRYLTILTQQKRLQRLEHTSSPLLYLGIQCIVPLDIVSLDAVITAEEMAKMSLFEFKRNYLLPSKLKTEEDKFVQKELQQEPARLSHLFWYLLQVRLPQRASFHDVQTTA